MSKTAPSAAELMREAMRLKDEADAKLRRELEAKGIEPKNFPMLLRDGKATYRSEQPRGWWIVLK